MGRNAIAFPGAVQTAPFTQLPLPPAAEDRVDEAAPQQCDLQRLRGNGGACDENGDLNL